LARNVRRPRRHRSANLGSPIIARLAAAAIVTLFVIAAKFVGGPRTAAATGVVGTLIAVLMMDWLA